MSKKFHSVIFKDRVTGFHEIVPVSEACEFHDKTRLSHTLYGALSNGKFPFSYAKAWYWSDSDKTARIGAGAYGDFTVAESAKAA